MSEQTTYIIAKRPVGRRTLTASSSPARHDTPGQAITEAKRLARIEPDSEFLVFQAVAKAVYQPVTVTTMADLDAELPF